MASPAEDKSSGAFVPVAEPVHPKRFRFKQQRRDRDRYNEDQQRSSRNEHHLHRRHHHRSKKRKISHSPVDDPSAYDDSASRLPPDSAFRESLFDAMGDDEGAAFWEGVYGQPIHTYPHTYHNHATGELEEMDDEEYAQFVRRKMWEKSWEGIEATKEEKRREAKRERERIRNAERTKDDQSVPQPEADYLFDLDIEKSLRRGERRRDKRRWKALWEDYVRRWTELQSLRESLKAADIQEQLFLRNKIAWPVETGKRKDVIPEEIERFITHCAEATDSGGNPLHKILKLERVRWHPDKIQQRYGSLGIDEGTMQGVTAVFQVLDRMWNDVRARD